MDVEMQICAAAEPHIGLTTLILEEMVAFTHWNGWSYHISLIAQSKWNDSALPASPQKETRHRLQKVVSKSTAEDWCLLSSYRTEGNFHLVVALYKKKIMGSSNLLQLILRVAWMFVPNLMAQHLSTFHFLKAGGEVRTCLWQLLSPNFMAV